MPKNRKCVVLGCQTASKHKYKFPEAGDSRLPVWLAAAGNAALLNLPPQKLRNATICRNHFEKKYILAIRLAVTAVPTINLPTPIEASRYLQTWGAEREIPPEEICNENITAIEDVQMINQYEVPAKKMKNQHASGVQDANYAEVPSDHALNDANKESAAKPNEESAADQPKRKRSGTTAVRLKMANDG